MAESMRDRLVREIRELTSKVEKLILDAEADGRDLTGDDFQTVTNARETLDGMRSRLAELDEWRAERDRAAAAAAELDDAGSAPDSTRTDPVVQVTSEPLTYREGCGHSFVTDAFRAQFRNDPQAQARISRHQAEMEDIEGRDVATSAFAGLVVPQYLTDFYAPLARAGRVTANLCRSVPLPDAGMTVNISRITTGTATAVQASENSAVQETDIDDTLLTVDVRTIAGQQDVSRQAVERGTLIDQVVLEDLAGSYAAALDAQVINGSGSSGQMLGILGTSGINAVTYTDASPTVAEAFPKIADAIQQINTARYLPADVIVMHPRRWGWFTAAVDTQTRPLVVPNQNAPQNAVGVGQPAEYGPVGTLFGLPVYTDANIPTNLGGGTNEDRIIVTRSSELFLWEQGSGAPRALSFEETAPGNLTIKFVVFGFAAFTAGRYPASSSVISGTGLATPTF